MHRTEGDGFKVDPIGGQNVFADEDPPIRDATQLRYQEANTYQEEIANVILHAGMSLNTAAETIQQMVQLRDAINSLIAAQVSAEAAIRLAADDALALLISPNTIHRGSDGKDHSDVVLNNAHRISDGKNHSDVVLNNTFRGIMENSVVITPITMTSDGGISGQASFLRYRYSGRRLELEISFSGTLSGSPTYIDLDLTVIPGIDGSSTFWPQLGICILSIPILPVSIAGVTQINSGRNFRFITNGTLPVGNVITMDYRTVLHQTA